MKSILILALGATTLAAAGSAFAGDREAAGFNAMSRHRSAMVQGERWGGGPHPRPIDRNCECSVPTVVVPFYTVREAAPPMYVRAPGVHIVSEPIYAPSPSVYIQSPAIYVDAPPIQVAPAQVYLEAPDVHVRPSDVTVAPPEIHFTPSSGAPDNCCRVAPPPPPVNHSGYAQEPGERG